jgi:hypothetical protein
MQVKPHFRNSLSGGSEHLPTPLSQTEMFQQPGINNSFLAGLSTSFIENALLNLRISLGFQQDGAHITPKQQYKLRFSKYRSPSSKSLVTLAKPKPRTKAQYYNLRSLVQNSKSSDEKRGTHKCKGLKT